ncbi:uncharacterized protein O3C94_002321 isoform 1-T2 [Discoglossus pictus]
MFRGREWEQESRNGKGKTNLFECKLCDVRCTSATQLEEHSTGMRHMDKLVRQDLEQEKLKYFTKDTNKTLKRKTSELEKADKLLQSPQGKIMFEKRDSVFFCKICNVSCGTRKTLEVHVVGKKHLKNEQLQSLFKEEAQDLKNVTNKTLKRKISELEKEDKVTYDVPFEFKTNKDLHQYLQNFKICNETDAQFILSAIQTIYNSLIKYKKEVSTAKADLYTTEDTGEDSESGEFAQDEIASTATHRIGEKSSIENTISNKAVSCKTHIAGEEINRPDNIASNKAASYGTNIAQEENRSSAENTISNKAVSNTTGEETNKPDNMKASKPSSKSAHEVRVVANKPENIACNKAASHATNMTQEENRRGQGSLTDHTPTQGTREEVGKRPENKAYDRGITKSGLSPSEIHPVSSVSGAHASISNPPRAEKRPSSSHTTAPSSSQAQKQNSSQSAEHKAVALIFGDKKNMDIPYVTHMISLKSARSDAYKGLNIETIIKILSESGRLKEPSK